ncbi:MAG TPA: TIGR02147 family protein [Chitinispirillaceae bacterium]|nr:TIGR02147 family protein [Chitinispirillaceae bacterium]
MLSIFEFIDYRRFLAEYYQSKKKTARYFSYRYFSQKIGINSPSFLKHVIDGQRNLTPQMTERFAKALGFSPKEKKFFYNLVLFNQATTSVEKQEYYSVLRSMISAVKESVLGADQYDFYVNWYTPVIRELICLYNFDDNYDLMASILKPRIEAFQAKAAVTLLLRLKLVEKLENGGYKQTSSAIVADDSVTSIAIRTFTRNMIDHSRIALDTIDKTSRHISGITMGISPQAYELLTAEIEAFKDRVKFIVNNDRKSSRIYQMNISLFPVSEDIQFFDIKNTGIE